MSAFEGPETFKPGSFHVEQVEAVGVKSQMVRKLRDEIEELEESLSKDFLVPDHPNWTISTKIKSFPDGSVAYGVKVSKDGNRSPLTAIEGVPPEALILLGRVKAEMSEIAKEYGMRETDSLQIWEQYGF